MACNNEVLAREGIDTHRRPFRHCCLCTCNNEVLAREGIDTLRGRSPNISQYGRNNEVLAREGIDTISTVSTLQLSPVSRNEV